MGFRILVVEDDPVSREVVASLLADRGYEIETADDGFNALRVAQDRVFDLVLIDYHLPEMDGYALARLMRSLSEKTNASMKMIAITADQFGLAARRGADTIFDRTLAKPIDPATFPDIIADLLGPGAALQELEGFLAPGADAATTSPSLALWRTRGLDRVPVACVLPTPTPAERANLAHCFDIVDGPAGADCLVLLRDAGLAEVEALRRHGHNYLLPLVAVDKGFEAVADVFFEPGDGDSWTRIAAAIAGFAARRDRLGPELADPPALDMRLAAFLYVADRALELRRGAGGLTVIPQASGFRDADIVAAVKSLLGKNLVTTSIDKDAQTLSVKLQADLGSPSRQVGAVTR